MFFSANLQSCSKSSQGAADVTVECPICYRKNPKSIIQSHVDGCLTQPINPFEVDDNEESAKQIREEFSNNARTYNSPTQEPFIENLDDLITAQQASEVHIFRVIRNKSWSMYIDRCRHKWFKRNGNIAVSFTGELGVGDGPKREFFEGIGCLYIIISLDM